MSARVSERGVSMTEPAQLRQDNDGGTDPRAELVRAHYQGVYRFLAHLTRDVHKAEDLTQETFAAAWRNWASFQGKSAWATWLHRIAYTKFIDAQRAERRGAAFRERLGTPDIVSADPLDSMMADDETRRLYG